MPGLFLCPRAAEMKKGGTKGVHRHAERRDGKQNAENKTDVLNLDNIADMRQETNL